MSSVHPLAAKKNPFGALHLSNDAPKTTRAQNSILTESSSDRHLSRRKPRQAIRSGSCQLLGMTQDSDTTETTEKTAATSSTLFLNRFLREPVTSPPPTPRSSPRRILWWKNDTSLVSIVSEYKESSKYTDIFEMGVKLKELQTFLKFKCNKTPFKWYDRDIILNQEDTEEAIRILEEILNKSWSKLVSVLVAAKVNTSEIVPGDKLFKLTNIHGEVVEFAVLKKIGTGGCHEVFLIRMLNRRKAVLLVAKTGVESPRLNSVWTGKQIEKITWREEVTKKIASSEIEFFPKHLHTFALEHEHSLEPCGAYILEKLNPLDNLENKRVFCKRLIELLSQFHGLTCVHGDIKIDNILRDFLDMPRFIDLDPYCYVNFTAFRNMNADEAAEQWEKIKQAGITSLFTPPNFETLMFQYYKTNNIDAAFTLLKIKDRYGLALAIWEILYRPITDLQEKGKVLSADTFEIMKTTMKELKSTTLRTWIIESIQTGLSLSLNDDESTSGIDPTDTSTSQSSGMNSSSSSTSSLLSK